MPCNERPSDLLVHARLRERRRAAKSQQHHGGSLPNFTRMVLGEQSSFKKSRPCSHTGHSQKLAPGEVLEAFPGAEGSLCQHPPTAHLHRARVMADYTKFSSLLLGKSLALHAHTHTNHTSVFTFVTYSCPEAAFALAQRCSALTLRAALPSKAAQAAAAPKAGREQSLLLGEGAGGTAKGPAP